MRRSIVLAALAFLAGALPSHGQAPFVRVQPTVTLAVTNVSANVALGTDLSRVSTLWTCNTGAVDANIFFGDSTVVATSTGTLLRAGLCGNISPDGKTYLAAITASGSTTLSITPGSGVMFASGTGNGPTTATLSTQGFKSSFSITRTNDTNAYTANDVVGAATGSTAAVTLANIGPAAGGEVMITSCRFEIDSAALISGETGYNFYLYNVTPPSALGDNVAFDIPAGDRASYVAKISFGTPIDEGSTLTIDVDAINKQVTVPSGGSLFAYLVTVGAYTPTASRVYSGICHSIGL